MENEDNEQRPFFKEQIREENLGIKKKVFSLMPIKVEFDAFFVPGSVKVFGFTLWEKKKKGEEKDEEPKENNGDPIGQRIDDAINRGLQQQPEHKTRNADKL